MGTQLQARGLAEAGALPELLNFTHADEIAAIHADYVAAGAEVVTTNTFGANARKLAGAASVVETYRAAAACARAAGARYVAGDIGRRDCFWSLWAPARSRRRTTCSPSRWTRSVAAGCDLVLIETMADLREAKAALLAAKERCDLPVVATMTFGEDGRTFLGTPPGVAAAALSAMGAHAVGLNCSLGPDEVLPSVREMARFARCPLLVQPNAGLPRVEGGRTVYDVTPTPSRARWRPSWRPGRASWEACCGTSPEFIARLRALVDARAVPAPPAREEAFVVTSAQEAVVLPRGAAWIAVIGERINPTGKPKLKEALRAGDLDHLVGEAVAQHGGRRPTCST